MPPVQEPRPRNRSSFAAAALSLVFPGLGHAYAGAGERALAFAAAPLLLLALGAGVVLRLDPLQLAGLAVQGWFLTLVFILNLVVFGYRLVAALDAWRVAQYLNDYEVLGPRGAAGRRPGMAAVAGLLAVAIVMSGAHVAVARYDLVAAGVANCIFTDGSDADCADPSPSGPAGTDPGASPASTASPLSGTVPPATVPPWNGTDRLNILLVGTDERPGDNGGNTDTLIVVSVDPGTRRAAMFTLPRDTVDVPIPAGPARNFFGSVYAGKVNSFFFNVRNRGDLFPGTAATRGYIALKALLGELYGLNIQYFAAVNFDGFIRIVDALGGVTINVQVPIVDDSYPDGRGGLMRVYIPAGIQQMTGAEALVYARSRHGSNDFDRGQRQQRVLVSLRNQVDIATILPRFDSLAAALGQAVRTDIPRELVPQLLGLAETIDARSIRSYVFSPPLYQTETANSSRGYIVQPKVAAIRAVVKNALSGDPELAATRELVSAEAARVWVLSGSSRGPGATSLAAYLEYLGIAASAPSIKAEAPADATRIVVYNGAEQRLVATIATLESVFGVTAVVAADPAIQADIVLTVGSQTPALTPPPAP